MIDYRAGLLAAADPDAYLVEHSNLPGPRGNLELMAVAADVASEEEARRWGAADHEYLAACGAMALARFGDEAALVGLARDGRWRVREGVVLGLQRFVGPDVPRLLALLARWAAGDDLERRAAAATLAEPWILADPAAAARLLDLLDRLTVGVREAPDRRADAFRTLRKTLGYAWSVAVVAAPDPGRARFERWLEDDDRDVRWIVRENPRKARLARLDPAWLETCRARVGL